MVQNTSQARDARSAGREEIERVLAHTLEHFHAIVQSSDDAIISKTIDGLVTSWNSGAQSIFGYTEEEMLGQPILALFPPDKVGEEDYILGQVLNGAKVDHFETERLHKNGTRINVSVTISPIRDRNGNIVGASKIVRDITNRLRLEASDQIASAILHSTDDAVVAISLDGIVTRWNPGARRLFGYSADEIINQPMRMLVPTDRHEQVDQVLGRIRAGDTVKHFETMRLCKDGRSAQVSVTISPLRDRSGRIVGASEIARDISEEKAAERSLRLTASVFSSTNEGILIIGADGLIADVNQAFTAITGYSKDRVVGTPAGRLDLARHSVAEFRKLQLAVKEHGEWKGELWSRRFDGKALAVSMTVSRVCDVSGDVSNYVALLSDITALKAQQEQLQHLAHFDALTHLPNRLLLSDRLRQAIVNCERRRQLLAVLYMDIDGFKTINDSFGHGVGDALLVALSERMRKALREGDTLARIGGDEFVIVLANLDNVQDCVQLVQRMLSACARPVNLGSDTLAVSASIGVTVYPGDDVDADQLLRHADQAMYEAKRTGKGRYSMFDAAQDAEVKSIGVRQSRIALGLEQGEFVLHYQPKVNMRTGRVVGVEALIRWQHPERGLLFPGDFLPEIEKHPLCESLGIWVMQSAFHQADAWQCEGFRLPISINVAARQLQNEKFPANLNSLLAHYPDISPSDIELEILETSALEDVASVQTIMQTCRQTGVQFSLDDFGTGYSSLTYLQRLPASTLKIDQSFVREMLVDAGSLSIVKGVIGLAIAFGREVIAEGVETEAHGVELLKLGCSLGQGYAIAKAMPAHLVIDWVSNWRAPHAWSLYVAPILH